MITSDQHKIIEEVGKKLHRALPGYRGNVSFGFKPDAKDVIIIIKETIIKET